MSAIVRALRHQPAAAGAAKAAAAMFSSAAPSSSSSAATATPPRFGVPFGQHNPNPRSSAHQQQKHGTGGGGGACATGRGRQLDSSSSSSSELFFSGSRRRDQRGLHLHLQQQQQPRCAPGGSAAPDAAATSPPPPPSSLPSPSSTRSAVARCASRLSVPLAPGTPSTLAGALASEPSDQARVVTEPYPPFTVVRVNGAWERLCGWSAEEVEGRTMALLQGPETDRSLLREVRDAASRGARARVVTVNYAKDGRPFLNALQVSPLYDGCGRVSHLLGVLEPQEQQQQHHHQEVGVEGEKK